MASFVAQVKLLLWKNFLLQRQKWGGSLSLVILPIGLAILLAYLKVAMPIEDSEAIPYNISYEPNLSYIDTCIVGYAPSHPRLHSVMSKLKWQPSMTRTCDHVSTQVRAFKTVADLEEFQRGPEAELNRMLMAVVFEGDFDISKQTLPNHIHMDFRVDPITHKGMIQNLSETVSVMPERDRFFNGIGGESEYRPLVALQVQLGQALVKEWTGSSPITVWEYQAMPFPERKDDLFTQLLETVLASSITYSYIAFAPTFTQEIVIEKEHTLKESMKLMGLMESAHWASWTLTGMLYLVFTAVLFTFAVGVPFNFEKGDVLGESDASIFFLLLLAYSVALLTFCLMISATVQKARATIYVSILLFLILTIPYWILRNDDDYSRKMAFCLSFNTALSMGMYVFGTQSKPGSALKWSTITESGLPNVSFGLSDALIMLMVDSAIHLLIMVFLSNVMPGTSTPKSLYYCFKASFWRSATHENIETGIAIETDNTNFETEPHGMTAGITARNLSKTFGGNVAVNNLSLNMLNGQITVLLGHNGAGKTTTMFMLTGFFPPSSGTAYINGLNIEKDMEIIRRDLGLCPQHNILFDFLTVAEHLMFFAQLKGCPPARVKQQVKQMVAEVGLLGKRNAMSNTLSGGQKRKLSLAIALIYGSKVVILDEPTSGMDPAARRQTWELLQRQRAGRTVLLSTHFMDEADVLGDRIAIMTEGQIQCCGSPMFLKKLYGTGYQLTVVKTRVCQVHLVTALIQQHVPAARLKSEVNTELCYMLPDDQSALFAKLFRQLQARSTELGIGDFGTTATTMEDVFLKVGENADFAKKTGKQKPKKPQNRDSSQNADESKSEILGTCIDEVRSPNVDLSTIHENQSKSSVAHINMTCNIDTDFGESFLTFNRGFDKLMGAPLQLTRFRAMLTKKMLITRRSYAFTVTHMFIPVFLVLIACTYPITPASPAAIKTVRLSFDLKPFGKTDVPYSNGPNITGVNQISTQAYATQAGLTSHQLENVDLRNLTMTDYLLGRAQDLTLDVYISQMVIGAQFSRETCATCRVAYYNPVPYHSLPISVNYLVQGHVRQHAGPSRKVSFSLTPFLNLNKAPFVLLDVFTQIFAIVYSLPFLICPCVFMVVKERQVGAKHLQEVSGVGPVVFWAANLTWDMFFFLIPTGLILVTIACFQPPALTEDGTLGVVALVMLLYGCAMLPFMYLCSCYFSTPEKAYIWALLFSVVGELLSNLIVMFIKLVTTLDANKSNLVLMIIMPQRGLWYGLTNIATNHRLLKSCKEANYTSTCHDTVGICCTDIGLGCPFRAHCSIFVEDKLAFSDPGIGRILLILCLQGVTYMTLILLVEFHVPQRLRGCVFSSRVDSGKEYVGDSDVVEEKTRIRNKGTPELCGEGAGAPDAVLLTDLYKKYGHNTVVDRVSVGVPENECFGLLGQNGAGKTSIFKMLTGQIMPTGGNAFVKGFDIKNNIKKVQSNLGYCPQFDTLHDQLTGRETLTLYARLRGVPSNDIDRVVESLSDAVQLTEHVDKTTNKYSGGTKRKLSTAIALVGDPAVVLMDEPSSGMDPGARRQLWNVLSAVRASGRTLVLTSHSMDECEALCTRIAIMVNGSLVCLGSPQHLKSKFAQGYSLLAKIAPTEEAQPVVVSVVGPEQRFITYVSNVFPTVLVYEKQPGYVHLQLPDPSVQLTDVFTLMERAKQDSLLQDYSLHMTSLEQVFLDFTRAQAKPAT